MQFVLVLLGFPTELTRKHVADMFLQEELEIEARIEGKLSTWVFKSDSDLEVFIQEVLSTAHSSLYTHQQSEKCSAVGMHTVYNREHQGSRTLSLIIN